MVASLHVLPERDFELPDIFWRVHSCAAHVVFESDLDNVEKPSFAFAPSAGLHGFIAPALHAAASELWEQGGRIDDIATFKPWFVALALGVQLTIRAGFSFRVGVDRPLWQRTPEDMRFLLEGRDAMQAFDRAPAHEQEAFLAFIVSDPNLCESDLRRLYSAWRAWDAVSR